MILFPWILLPLPLLLLPQYQISNPSSEQQVSKLWTPPSGSANTSSPEVVSAVTPDAKMSIYAAVT